MSDSNPSSEDRSVSIRVPVTPRELSAAHRNASVYADAVGIKNSTAEVIRHILVVQNPMALVGRRVKNRKGMRWLCVEVAEDVAMLLLKQEDPGAAIAQSVRREFEMVAGG